MGPTFVTTRRPTHQQGHHPGGANIRADSRGQIRRPHSGVPVHVVSRRLGHGDVQTTLELYAHVTEDADMRSVAEWRAFTAGWRAVSVAGEQIGRASCRERVEV